jgi:hypothetical protein
LRIATTSSGARVSDSVVKPRMSEKSSVTSRVWPSPASPPRSSSWRTTCGFTKRENIAIASSRARRSRRYAASAPAA